MKTFLLAFLLEHGGILTVLAILAIVYGISFIPALRMAIAFWLYKDSDATAYMAMKNGFLIGFFSIWLIYPVYIVKDCYNSLKR